jgi:hypothetical protein
LLHAVKLQPYTALMTCTPKAINYRTFDCVVCAASSFATRLVSRLYPWRKWLDDVPHVSRAGAVRDAVLVPWCRCMRARG